MGQELGDVAEPHTYQMLMMQTQYWGPHTVSALSTFVKYGRQSYSSQYDSFSWKMVLKRLSIHRHICSWPIHGNTCEVDIVVSHVLAHLCKMLGLYAHIA